MSSPEIVHLILGVIPILQAGLKQLHGQKLKTLLKYQQAIASFERQLDVEHLKFRNTCELLLGPIIEEEDLAELLNSTAGDGWKKPDLAIRLKERLGDSAYIVYEETLRHLAMILLGLQEETGLRQSKQTDRWYEKVSKRMKACLKSSKHLELLKDIKECNQSLHQLTDDCNEMQPIRTSRKSRGDTVRWEATRKHARSLHETLESGLICGCTDSHVAHLRLETRSEKGEREVRFGVLFSRDAEERGWQETEIRIARSDDAESLGSVSTITRTRTSSSTTPKTTMRSVSFSTNATAVEIDLEPPNPALPSEMRIVDLCCELGRNGKKPGCIGFLADEINRKHYYIHSVYPTTMLGEDLSLHQLLNRNKTGQSPSVSARLSLKEKYDLALTLATSVLQLHATPWLETTFWSKDVRFVRTKENNSAAGYAYIQKKFGQSCESPIPKPEVVMPTVRNKTIFALGVTLIELSLGQALSSFQKPEDLGPNCERNMVTDWTIAQRLLKEIQANEGDRYTDTVNRCINCIFEGLVPSLEDDRFRQSFYQSAVIPLREVRDDFKR